MSISDRIVVMKDGVLHQSGKPQDVYDDPADLFVATFLGTPPINLFTGAVRGGRLFIGTDDVMAVDCPDAEGLTVAVRPEGLVPETDGALRCGLNRVEVMGRDISVVCAHTAFTGDTFRAIVDSDDMAKLTGTEVRFRLKRNKVFLFRSDSGERIRF